MSCRAPHISSPFFVSQRFCHLFNSPFPPHAASAISCLKLKQLSFEVNLLPSHTPLVMQKSMFSVLALAVTLVAAIPAHDMSDFEASTLEKRVTHNGQVRSVEPRRTFVRLYADPNSMVRQLGSMLGKVRRLQMFRRLQCNDVLHS